MASQLVLLLTNLSDPLGSAYAGQVVQVDAVRAADLIGKGYAVASPPSPPGPPPVILLDVGDSE